MEVLGGAVSVIIGNIITVVGLISQLKKGTLNQTNIDAENHLFFVGNSSINFIVFPHLC